MSIVGRSRAFVLGCGAAALAGCGGTSGLSPSSQGGFAPNSAHVRAGAPAPSLESTLLYQFVGGSADGAYPYAGLVADSSGNLYGTTNGGGAAGLGTVFKLTPSGSTYTETVLHEFAGGTGDGELPYGNLVLGKKGVLYGTTYGGGEHGAGCVFALTPSGETYAESVVYSFAGSPNDGGNPYAGLVEGASGTLYGTTLYGGSSGAGTVYELVPSGKGFTESVVYAFAGGSDGANPYAGVSLTKTGALYGTTTYGGTAGDGTVYSLTKSGTTYAHDVLHSFAGGSDGANPYGAPVSSSGAFLGTTQNGGSASDGTIYEVVVTKGKATETVAHSFLGGSADGAQPEASLLVGKKGAVYGTTDSGGANSAGTVFELTKTKKTYAESLLTSFPGYPGSANPKSTLIASAAGTLYGTTYGGGNDGYGTVFSLTP